MGGKSSLNLKIEGFGIVDRFSEVERKYNGKIGGFVGHVASICRESMWRAELEKPWTPLSIS